MPQLDISTFPSQVFWLILCFAITYIATAFWFVPKIESIQTVRTKKIKRHLEKAKTCQEQTQSLLKEYEDILKNAKNDAVEIITKAHKKSQEESLELETQIGGWLKHELKIVEGNLDLERKVTQEDLKEAVDEITKTLEVKIKNTQETLDLADVIEKKVFHG